MSKDNNSISLIPTRHSSVFQIQLNLPSQTRFIGKIDFAGEGTFCTSRKPKHLFRKSNSLGLNLELLKDESIFFKWIRIQFDNHSLITSRLYFLTHGKVFTFGKAGFETQAFLPLDEFGINRAREFEAHQVIQGSLFEPEPVV